MKIENLFQSKQFRWVILALAVFLILAFVFGLGIFVGTKRADFSFAWADAYHRNFGGPQGGVFGDFMGKEFTDANGVFGQIIKIDGQNLTIKGKDNVEKIVLLGDKTTIVFQRKSEKLSDLKTGDSVVVVGDPNNNGQIQAELIRVLPPLPKNSPASNLPILPN